jgi:ABC-type sugar transport system substrate-binding protein
MTMLSNEYPSKTRPILLAKQVAAMNPDVVISNFWIPELYPQVGKTYLDACVPFLNMHAFKIDFIVPGFQNSYPATGIALADGVIKLVREKNWPIEETWLMVCGTPIIAKGEGTLEDVLRHFTSRVESELKIPKERQSGILDCKEDADGARVVATDWLTAHPDAKRVIAVYWNDLIALAMAQALKAKGYTPDTAIAAGGDASDAALEVMTQADSILQVNADKDFPTWGIIALSMAQDVAAGRPVPAFVDTGVVPVVGADAARKMIEDRKANQ